jgi:hypothetical protein
MEQNDMITLLVFREGGPPFQVVIDRNSTVSELKKKCGSVLNVMPESITVNKFSMTL